MHLATIVCQISDSRRTYLSWVTHHLHIPYVDIPIHMFVDTLPSIFYLSRHWSAVTNLTDLNVAVLKTLRLKAPLQKKRCAKKKTLQNTLKKEGGDPFWAPHYGVPNTAEFI